MDVDYTTDLTDVSFVERAFARGWQQTMCPRCNVPMIRDLAETQYPVYACPKCVTRWRSAC
jgi:hypothetical protein